MSASRDIPCYDGKTVWPKLGFGTWGSETDAPEVVANATEAAIRAGYRHIDMAEFYQNQKEIGVAINKCIKEGVVKREELFIVSKVWNTNHSHVVDSCKQTLQDLGLDYVDVLLVHWPLAWRYTGPRWENGGGIPKKDGVIELERVSLETTWRGMEACVRAGYTKHIGVSNYTAILLQDLLNYCEIPPICNQVEITPYLPQEGLVEFCQHHNIVVVAYGSLGRPYYKLKYTLLTEPVVLEICKELGGAATPAHVLLQWAMQRNIAVIPKSSTPARIAANLGAHDIILSPAHMEKMKSLNYNYRCSNPALYGDVSFGSRSPVLYE